MATRSVNKVILIGHLGADPELRYTQSGTEVANLRIATNESYMDKASGQPVERTEWHRVVAWSKLAEIVGQYLTKGRQIYVEGRLQTRKWTDKEGSDRYSTEIRADEIVMLGGRGEGGPAMPAAGRAENAPATGEDVHYAPVGEAKEDDDLPF